MVCVFPVPLRPYASTHALKPASRCSTAGAPSAENAAACDAPGGSTPSRGKGTALPRGSENKREAEAASTEREEKVSGFPDVGEVRRTAGLAAGVEGAALPRPDGDKIPPAVDTVGGLYTRA